MNLQNTYLLSDAAKAGFDDSVLTSEQINMNNWTKVGDINIEYENNINNLTWTVEEVPATTAEQIVAGFAKFGIICSLEIAQDMINRKNSNSSWQGRTNTPVSYAFMVGENSAHEIDIVILPYYTGLDGLGFCPHPNAPKKTVAYYNNDWMSQLQYQFFYNFDTTTNTIGAFKIGSVGGNAKLLYNDMKGFLTSYTTSERTLSLNLEGNYIRHYYLQFDYCSPSGFEDEGNNIVITTENGSQIYSYALQKDSSQEMKHYEFYFSTSLYKEIEIKFILSNILNYENNNISLKIGNITLYEIASLDDLIVATGNPLSFVAKKAQTAISTKISMEPIQDLHGYDYPWPAGGNVNKFNPNNTEIGVPSTRFNLSVTINDDESIRIYGNPTWSADMPSPTFVLFTALDDLSGLVGNIFTVSKLSNITSVNSVVLGSTGKISINITKTGKDYVDFTVKISFASASVASWTPYSNICPISGRTGVEVDGCGKNLFDKDNSSSIINANIPAASSGTIPANANSRLVFIKCKPNTTYTVSKTAGERFRVCTTVDIPADGVACSQITSDNTASSITITTNSTAEYLCSYVYNTTVDSGTDVEMIASVQIEEGTSATPYEAYQSSNEITISFGETVYGGTLNVETGECVVDRAIVTIGNYAWTYSESDGTFRRNFNSMESFDESIISSALKPDFTAYNLMSPWSIRSGGSSSVPKRIVIKPSSDITTQDALFNIIGNETILYKLATPRTISLTSEQVQLLKGANTLWTDGDSIELKYIENIN